MSASKPVRFGRFTFPSTKAAIANLSRILNSYNFLQRVTDPEHAELLQEVLKKHSDAQGKTRGIAIIAFEVHPFKGGERCFYLCREDGSKEHFGFQKCVRNAANG